MKNKTVACVLHKLPGRGQLLMIISPSACGKNILAIVGSFRNFARLTASSYLRVGQLMLTPKKYMRNGVRGYFLTDPPALLDTY